MPASVVVLGERCDKPTGQQNTCIGPGQDRADRFPGRVSPTYIVFTDRFDMHTKNGRPGWPTRKGETMPLYLSKFSYTPETWARLIGHPEDRREAAQSYIQSVGGKLHGFWYAFGSHDGFTLWEAPDNVSMAAVALALGSGGALSSLETTVLLTVDETLEALRRADQVQYRAPGA